MNALLVICLLSLQYVAPIAGRTVPEREEPSTDAVDHDSDVANFLIPLLEKSLAPTNDNRKRFLLPLNKAAIPKFWSRNAKKHLVEITPLNSKGTRSRPLTYILSDSEDGSVSNEDSGLGNRDDNHHTIMDDRFDEDSDEIELRNGDFTNELSSEKIFSTKVGAENNIGMDVGMFFGETNEELENFGPNNERKLLLDQRITFNDERSDIDDIGRNTDETSHKEDLVPMFRYVKFDGSDEYQTTLGENPSSAENQANHRHDAFGSNVIDVSEGRLNEINKSSSDSLENSDVKSETHFGEEHMKDDVVQRSGEINEADGKDGKDGKYKCMLFERDSVQTDSGPLKNSYKLSFLFNK